MWSLIYETKGLSLEQVDEMYAKIPHAWNSRKFKPTLRFTDVQEYGGGKDDVRRQSLAEVEMNAIRKKSVVHEDGYGGLKEY